MVENNDKAKVDEWLNDPDLLGRVERALSERIVGVSNQKIIVWLIMHSRYTHPLSLHVHADSRGGKTHLVEGVAETFERDIDYYDFTSMTQTAIKDFKTEDKRAFVGKTLILGEYNVFGENALLRQAISDHKIRCMDRVQLGNKWITQEIDRSFQCNVITTSVEHIRDSQMRNRFLKIAPDLSAEQSRRIKDYIDNIEYQSSENYEMLKRVNNALRLEYDQANFWIPFKPEVDYPMESLRARDDVQRLYNLTSCVTNVYRNQREAISVGAKIHFISTFHDFETALRLFDSIYMTTSSGVSDEALKLYKWMCDIMKDTYTEGCGLTKTTFTSYPNGITSKEVAERSDINWGQKKIERCLKELKDNDMMSYDNINRNSWRYSPRKLALTDYGIKLNKEKFTAEIFEERCNKFRAKGDIKHIYDAIVKSTKRKSNM